MIRETTRQLSALALVLLFGGLILPRSYYHDCAADHAGHELPSHGQGQEVAASCAVCEAGMSTAHPVAVPDLVVEVVVDGPSWTEVVSDRSSRSLPAAVGRGPPDRV